MVCFKNILELIFFKSWLATGGAFILPLADFAMNFWKYVQDELKKKDTRVGLAILNYCTFTSTIKIIIMD